MEKKRHLAIEIVPDSDMDEGQTNNQFACFHIRMLDRMENQTDNMKNHKFVKIGAAHQPSGEPTIDAAVAIGSTLIDTKDVLDGLMQRIVDYFEQIQL